MVRFFLRRGVDKMVSFLFSSIGWAYTLFTQLLLTRSLKKMEEVVRTKLVRIIVRTAGPKPGSIDLYR